MIYLEHSPMRPALILSLGLAPLSMLAQVYPTNNI